MKLILISLFLILIISQPTFAWDGYDYEKGSYVEIDKGNLVRSGNNIEIYDDSTGEYKNVEVESVHDGGSTVEVEVYDSETGESRTLEMDKE